MTVLCDVCSLAVVEIEGDACNLCRRDVRTRSIARCSPCGLAVLLGMRRCERLCSAQNPYLAAPEEDRGRYEWRALRGLVGEELDELDERPPWGDEPDTLAEAINRLLFPFQNSPPYYFEAFAAEDLAEAFGVARGDVVKAMPARRWER